MFALIQLTSLSSSRQKIVRSNSKASSTVSKLRQIWLFGVSDLYTFEDGLGLVMDNSSSKTSRSLHRNCVPGSFLVDNVSKLGNVLKYAQQLRSSSPS